MSVKNISILKKEKKKKKKKEKRKKKKEKDRRFGSTDYKNLYIWLQCEYHRSP